MTISLTNRVICLFCEVTMIYININSAFTKKTNLNLSIKFYVVFLQLKGKTKTN